MKKLSLLLFLLLSLPLWAQPTVLISIDGMNRAFYQSSDFPAPELQRMAREGASAKAVLPVFPSLTYPDHAALVTGCRPALSGVPTNLIEGRPEWYWESRHFTTETLWEVAEEQGLRVGLMGWPTTVGAEVHHNIPEVFFVPNTGPLSTEQRIAKHSTPGTMDLLEVKVPKDFPTWDRYMTKACEKLLREDRVDLLLVHLIQVDKAQHLYGPDAPQVKEAIAAVDTLVGRIRRAAGPNALVAVVGDHGFQAYQQILYPKAMLRAGGFSEKVSAHAAGGSAAIFGGDEEVKRFFRQEAMGRYRVVERQELDALGAFPGADFALAVLGPVIFSHKEHGPPVTERTKGQHGHLPEMVPTGWVMTGPTLEPGSQLGLCQIIDVAPTLAAHLGLRLPRAQGQDRLKRSWFMD